MQYKWVTIFGNVPSKANQYQVIRLGGHLQLGKSKALKDYEEKFLLQVGDYRDLNIDKFFRFYAKVYYPSMRTDLDNAFKVILDCLQKANAITNDNRCLHIEADKYVDKVNPRIEFMIETFD